MWPRGVGHKHFLVSVTSTSTLVAYVQPARFIAFRGVGNADPGSGNMIRGVEIVSFLIHFGAPSWLPLDIKSSDVAGEECKKSKFGNPHWNIF